MRKRMSAVGLAVAAVLGGVALAGGRKRPPRSNPRRNSTSRPCRAIWRASRRTRSRWRNSFDEVQDDGQKLQVSNQRHMSVSRPTKCSERTRGTRPTPYFTTTARQPPSTTEDKDLRHREGARHHRRDARRSGRPIRASTCPGRLPVRRPLQGVHGTRADRGPMSGCTTWGRRSVIDLAFRQKLLDWQIWIDAGEQPLPRNS